MEILVTAVLSLTGGGGMSCEGKGTLFCLRDSNARSLRWKEALSHRVIFNVISKKKEGEEEYIYCKFTKTRDLLILLLHFFYIFGNYLIY